MVKQLGNYRIIKKIATGGMAEIYLAKQVSLGGFERLVCIKRILPHLCENEEFIAMFKDEANIAANLVHPNIAQIYDIGQDKGSYFIAMEYVRGEDLRRIYNAEVAEGRPIPTKPAAQAAMYTALGLDFAHRQTTLDGHPLGLVHRDISPQNILVTYDGHVKIVDFGVAKAVNKIAETRSGVLKGKYSYMSPEQASGDPIDARTDVFALGITLYEVTTGTRLFKRDNELETLHAVVECNVTPPTEIISDYDPALEAILLRALKQDPDERYQSAKEMADALEGYLVSVQHPTSPASLAEYMQELFADKIADDMLLGVAKTDSKALGFDRMPDAEPGTQIDAPQNDRSADWSDEGSTTDIDLSTDLKRQETSKTQIDTSARAVLENEHTDRDDLRNQRPPQSVVSGLARSDWGETDLTRTDGWGFHSPKSKSANGQAGRASEEEAVTRVQARTDNHQQAPIESHSDLSAWRLSSSHPSLPETDRPWTRWLPFLVLFIGFSVVIYLRPLLLGQSPKAETPKPGPHITKLSSPPQPAKTPASHGTQSKAETKTAPSSTQPSKPQKNNAEKREPIVNKAALKGAPKPSQVVSNKQPQSSRAKEKAKKINAAGAARSVKNKPKPAPPKIHHGTLTLSASAEATVFNDGQRLGDIPIRRATLPVGTHQLQINVANGGILYKNVTIRPGQHSNVHLHLNRGRLRLEASPWAMVNVGRKAQSETPSSFVLLEGSYAVIFECSDGSRKRRQVEVRPGQETITKVSCDTL